MNEKRTLIGFLAVLSAIVILFITSAVLAFYGKSVEAIGISAIMTGLIGVLGSFRPQSGSQMKVDPPATFTVEQEK